MKVNDFIHPTIQNRSSINIHGNKALNATMTEIVSRTNCDTLSISEQGLLKTRLRDLDKKTESSQTNDAQFLKMVSNIVSSTLSYLKSNIEDTLDDYSSYKNKIESGDLDRQVSFNEYAESMEKNKRSSFWLQEDAKLESTAVPVDEDELVCLKAQAFDQLQNRIRELVSNADKNLDELFKNVKSNSKGPMSKINEMKGIITEFFSEEFTFNHFSNESEFTAAIHQSLENMDKLIKKVVNIDK